MVGDQPREFRSRPWWGMVPFVLYFILSSDSNGIYHGALNFGGTKKYTILNVFTDGKKKNLATPNTHWFT